MASRRYEPATCKRPPSAAAQRGLRAALFALYAPAPALQPDQALAECEQRRLDVEALRRRQGELRLSPKAGE